MLVSPEAPAKPDSSLDPALLVSGPEAARRLGISLRTIYQLAYQGRLHWLHLGRASRISVAELERLVVDLRAEADQ